MGGQVTTPGRAGAARIVGLVAAALALLVATAAPAAADPAGPTDYRTDIISVEPPVPDIDLRIIGGDSFLQLTVPAGTVVDVRGYSGEPYLRFEADGTVLQNERSPSRWLNDDRYGASEVPADADGDARPEWATVATDGSYAWHDHRVHWMNTAPPPGAAPGDTVLEAVVPLVVAGDEVEVHVRSTLLGAPSPVPTALGAVVAAAAAAALLRAGGIGRISGRRALAVLVAVWSAAASVTGLWARFSVPPETGPSLLLWIPPLIALAAVVVVAVDRPRSGAGTAGGAGRAGAVDLATLLLSLAGLELALWFWVRRDALARALIPSDAPPAVDRFVIAGAIVIGVVALVQPLVARLRVRVPRPAPRSAP